MDLTCAPVKKMADSQYTNVVKATFSAVKDPAKGFLSKSRALLEVLDKVARLHPVIEGMEPLWISRERVADLPQVAYNAFSRWW